MAKAKAVETAWTLTELDWLNHYSRSIINLASREAVTASNQRLAAERVQMIASYNGDFATMTEHISLSMTVFAGTKGQKQSLKRSLASAMVKATDKVNTLVFSGDNCTVKDYAAPLPKDTLSDAWDTLGEHVGGHVIEAMQDIFNKACTANREKAKALREQAEKIAEDDRTARAKKWLKEKGLPVSADAMAVAKQAVV